MASAYICVDCMMRLSVLGSDKGHFGPCNFCEDNDSKPCSLIESSKLPIADMFEEIKTDLNERMSHYTDSRQPTADEVRIAWLVDEVEKLRLQNVELNGKWVSCEVDRLKTEIKKLKDK